MIQLCVTWIDLDSSIVISMCLSKQTLFLPIKVNISTIEYDRWIRSVVILSLSLLLVQLDRLIKVREGFLEPIDVVVSKSSVVEMNSRMLKLDRFCVMREGLFKQSFFKIGQP